MTIQSAAFHQNTGFVYDSSNFAINFAATGTLLPSHGSVTMEDWETEDEEGDEEKIATPEIDPDLEDGDDEEEGNLNSDEGDEVSDDDDDDEFEQYLFGEDDD